MSVWHVNADWADFAAPLGHTVRWVTVPADDDAAPAVPGDVLSAPDVEDLLPAGLALWPRGAAWGAPDGEAVSRNSVLAGLTRVLLAPFAELYTRAWRLTLESRSLSLVDSLPDWERDYGLPGPCSAPEDRAVRIARLRTRVRRLATITPADFIALAAGLGYVTAIEEPVAFRCGQTPLGGYGEPTDTGLERQWVMRVRDVPFAHFEAGIGETGVTRLLDIDRETLECEVRRLEPSWTRVVFNYGPHPETRTLVTEDGDALLTETGEPLLAVIAV
ncbi:hypothetical protein AY599_18275 [Leptolyngbya valderiana BDU 20041]|nr:hypothetical protein AY599_18275 [Leptolyngbya valderiana BDU 20041]